MTAFEQAFALLKIDEGYWKEIYEPLLAQTTGMGDLQHSRYTTDFVPTEFAMNNIRSRHYNPNWGGGGHNDIVEFLMSEGQFGDHGHTVEQLMESIQEHGFDLRGAERSGRTDPTFQWSPQGVSQYEGNHRILALNELGAPYVPYMGIASHYADAAPHLHDFGEEFKHHVLDNYTGYSLSDRFGRSGRLEVAPSWLYGRELVPSMGRLVPVNYEGEPMNLHTDTGDNREAHRWSNEPAWKVMHDE